MSQDTQIQVSSQERALAAQETKKLLQETSIVGVPSSLAGAIEIAKVMGASGLYPDYGTAQKAAGAIVIGAQYGLSPAQSLGAIHIVKGKPMLHYSLILAKVREHPDYDYKIIESSDERATVEFLRHDSIAGVETFTLAQAKKQGTQNLDKFPDTMLLARAVSKGVKKFCPDVLNGMPTYVQGEIDEANQSYGTEPTKADSLREEMLRRAKEIVDGDQGGQEEPIEEGEIVPPSPLEAYGLTEEEAQEFYQLAADNEVSLFDVAAQVEPKSKDALRSAITGELPL